MKQEKLIIPLQIGTIEELSKEDSKLFAAAKEVATKAYAPYSKFSVGAAVLLEDGTIVTGSNQENAAYPSGICAERTALYYVGAHYPDLKVKTLLITAMVKGELVPSIAPCGACRQVLAEVSMRQKTPFRVVLVGKSMVRIVENNEWLLPVTFDGSDLPRD